MSEFFNFTPARQANSADWGNHVEPAPKSFQVRQASYGRRVGSGVIDYIGPILLLGFLGKWSFILFFPIIIANVMVWQGLTGKSLGKKVFGLTLCYIPNDTRDDSWYFVIPGIPRCAIRYVLHIFDMIFFIGLLRPLWNPFSRTYADSLTSTSVIHDDRVRVWTAAAAAEHRRG